MTKRTYVMDGNGTPRRVKPRTQVMFVLARTGKGRPTLQHRLIAGSTSLTACGLEIRSWSRAYQSEAIDAVLCKRRACKEGPME